MRLGLVTPETSRSSPLEFFEIALGTHVSVENGQPDSESGEHLPRAMGWGKK